MSIQVNLPEGLTISQFELSMLLAVKLFEEGLVTTGQGAEMVELSKQTFIELNTKFLYSNIQWRR